MSNRKEIRRLAGEIDKLKKESASLPGGYKSNPETKSEVKELLKLIKALDKEDSHRVLRVNKDTGLGRKVRPLPVGSLVRKSCPDGF